MSHRPAAPERTTHALDTSQGMAVFQIGTTIRRPHRPDLWLPAIAAMPAMLAELRANKAAAERGEAEDLGFLGGTILVGVKGFWVVQYWRSVEHLYAYAQNPERAHVPAWQAFHRRARRNPAAVGIWHETYAVRPGGVETLYVGGPRIGLGAATGLVHADRRGRSARQRMATPVPTPAHSATE